MGALPTTPKPLHAKISSACQNNVSVSHSLQQQVASRGGHRWMIDLAYPTGLSRERARTLWAFLVSCGGRFQPFDLVLPHHESLGSLAGAPVVDGTEQLGNTVRLKAFTPLAQKVLCAGDFIRFAGNYKSYMVTEDVDAEADGSASVDIFPALQASPVDNTSLVADAQFRVALTSDQLDVSVDDVLHYGLSFQCVEVLR